MPELKPKMERRAVAIELRVAHGDDDATPKIVGHAAVFDTLSEEMWGFREKIAKGAFKESIKEDDVRALFNHDANFVLGRNMAETLTLREDDEGLAIEIDPPDTQWANDLLVSLKRGDITQMSFGFIVMAEKWERGEKGAPDIRTLEKVQLFDVSPVTFPAYPETDVAVRSHKAFEESLKGRPASETRARLTKKRLDIAESAC